MSIARKLIPFLAGVLVGMALLAGGTRAPVISRWLEREPRSSATNDCISASSAHAENATAENAPARDLADAKTPAVHPSALPPAELDTWLRTLPLDTIRRAYWDQGTSLDDKIAEKFPKTKPEGWEKLRAESFQALRAYGDQQSYWMAETSITVGGKSLDLTLFFYISSVGSSELTDLSKFDPKSDLLYYWTNIYWWDDDKLQLATGLASAVNLVRTRGKWFITDKWSNGQIEKSYSAYAMTFPPFETTDASFELLGTADSQWTNGPALNWRPLTKEEYDDEVSKFNG